MPLTMVLVLVFVVGINLQGTWREIGSFVGDADERPLPF